VIKAQSAQLATPLTSFEAGLGARIKSFSLLGPLAIGSFGLVPKRSPKRQTPSAQQSPPIPAAKSLCGLP